MQSSFPAYQMILTGQVCSVVVDDLDVQLVIQDGSPQLDGEALAALQGKTVRVVVMKHEVIPDQKVS